jgi:hypothetical protein
MSYEEEDTCHMRRRIGEQPSLSSGLRRRIHVIWGGGQGSSPHSPQAWGGGYMSYEEEDRGAALTLLRLEEEDTCPLLRLVWHALA